MIQDYRDKKVCVIDNGSFLEMAVHLSKFFGKTYYHMPWETGFPTSNQLEIGNNLPGIERLDNFDDHKGDCDLYVFTDLYSGPRQLALEEEGWRVWGARQGEDLEIYRDKTKEYFRSQNFPIGNYEIVTGMDALVSYLQSHEDVHVKINKSRGDMESWHSINYTLSEEFLNELRHTLGARSKTMKFIVEEPINDAVEVGYDGYCIDGQFPKVAMVGVESKDRAYIGQIMPYTSMPKEVQDVNNALVPAFQQYRYRQFFSSEIRNQYPIDLTCRCPSPPSELYYEMFANLPDILWFGAEGRLIEPEIRARYGAELILRGDWTEKGWQALQFPEEYRDNIKLKNLTIIDGTYYVVPHVIGMKELGAVVATSDSSMEDAMEQCKEIAKQVKGYDIHVHEENLDQAMKDFEELPTPQAAPKKQDIGPKPSNVKMAQLKALNNALPS